MCVCIYTYHCISSVFLKNIPLPLQCFFCLTNLPYTRPTEYTGTARTSFFLSSTARQAVRKKKELRIYSASASEAMRK